MLPDMNLADFSRSHYFRTLPYIWFLIAVDQILKHMVYSSLVESSLWEVFPGVYLTCALNHGVAFSLFSNGQWLSWFLIVVSTAVINMCLFFALGFSHKTSKYFTLGVAFTLAGGLSNLLDRLFYGAVLDYIYLSYGGFHWPTVFNFADMCIVLGGLLLLFCADLYQPNSSDSLSA